MRTMEDTYIKAYRKLLKWRWADNSNMLALWIRLLLIANYEDKGWHNITIHRGQIVTSVAKLSAESGLSKQQIRTCLERLKETGEITIESTNKYTIITICNYDDYQAKDSECQQTNNNQITNEQQSNNNQITTTKEYKERKESKEDILSTNYQDNSMSVSATDTIPWNEIVEYFNNTTKGYLGKIRLPFSAKRKSSVRARIADYGLDTFYDVIRKAASSRFLTGDNKQNWSANFDWIIRPTNFEKVMSGNYDNKNEDTESGFEERREKARREAQNNYQPVTWENS